MNKKEINKRYLIAMILIVLIILIVAIIFMIFSLFINKSTNPSLTEGPDMWVKTKESNLEEVEEVPIKTEESNLEKVEETPIKTEETHAIKKEDIKENNEDVLKKLNTMTLEEKIAQLFIVSPEQLTEIEETIAAEETFKNAIHYYPVGGIILFSKNLVSPEQVIQMNQNLQKYSQERIGLPLFISIDEEGGEVARIADNSSFNVLQFENMNTIGNSGKTENAYAVGNSIGKYLSELKFNLNFAPVADVVPENGESYIETRSFGSEPVEVGTMVGEVVKGLHQHNIKTAIKHFPGLGSTYGDTHLGSDVTEKTLNEMEATDFISFKAGIDAGTDFVMVCGVSAPNVIGDNTPSSLSRVMVNDILRQKLNYTGLVITDAMNMEAIAQNYSSSQAAIMAMNAGVDVILMPQNFYEAYDGVLEAVKNGTISENRINDAVRKVIQLKNKL